MGELREIYMKIDMYYLSVDIPKPQTKFLLQIILPNNYFCRMKKRSIIYCILAI